MKNPSSAKASSSAKPANAVPKTPASPSAKGKKAASNGGSEGSKGQGKGRGKFPVPGKDRTNNTASAVAGQGEVITIRGVRQNNLKGIDLDLPLGKLNVITGPSGSGKSSLAFQTIYAEGQRRYVETFSPYTRQFFDRMDKPVVDEIRGIPPAIAIAQTNSVRTTRSTVGTMTEINDYLKLLFPRVAVGTCPSCGQPVQPDTPQAAADAALKAFADKTVLVTLPVPVPASTGAANFFPFLQSQGYLRVLLFGESLRTDEPESYKRAFLPPLVPVIQDRIRLMAANRGRFLEAIETAFHLGKGKLSVIEPESGKSLAFSKGWHCAHCDVDLREPTPALFTFNNPIGACPQCRGFGRTIGIDPDRALPDRSLSIKQGVVKAFSGAVYADSQRDLEKAARQRGVSLTTPFDDLDPEDQEWIMRGDPGYKSNDPENSWESGVWYGVRGFFDYLESKSYKMHVRVFLSRFRSYTTCRTCLGTRLQPESLAFRVGGHTLPEWQQWPVTRLMDFIAGLPMPAGDHTADQLQREIVSRLRYLEEVGLGYLNLDRSTRTLSGGEVMRVTLTTCLGASLVNTLFVLDEPSVGLHPRDTGRLIRVMQGLRDKGNTLLVVEHEESVMRAADNLIEIGPGRGELGGELVFHGPHSELPQARRSLTADYLLGRKSIPVPDKRRQPDPARVLMIHRASQNNLQKIDVVIPLGLFCAVTGVSGSGKSTLVHEVLYENLIRKKGLTSENEPGRCRDLIGDDLIKRVIMVDQSPPSRTPRSTPAVYTGAYDHIRALFASTPDAEAQELGSGYFSFNSGNGRCGRCQGAGYEKVEMQFLSDLYVKCPECEGKRFRPEALTILHHGKSIHDLLEMTVTEAIAFLLRETDLKANKAAAALKILAEVGLGYLRLGQPLNTLSGGESQRLKLVGHLLEGGSEPTLFILDEPTTGLHFDDINLLLQTFQRLVNEGHSLLVIEHNLEVIKCADWVIDLGPEAGADGGLLLGEGTPEQIARIKGSHTGQYLAELFTGYSKRGITSSAGPGPGLYPLPQPALPVAAESPAFLRPASAHEIRITGAREHNLKNISVTIPRDKLVVVTGLSGSGKSTLAFDIIFAEGQRRFLDSMSTYARQFVEQMEKPEVDHISGLPPTVAIEQRITRGGGKSTVATVTEIYHFLRLLYAKVGEQHCPDCQVAVTQQTPGAIASAIRSAQAKGPLHLMSPMIRGRKGFHTTVAAAAARAGCVEMWVDGKIIRTESFTKLERFKEHTIDGIITHLEKAPSVAELDALVARALDLGRGVLRLLDRRGNLTVLNTRRSCPKCSRSFDNLDPRLFSFNSPHGACGTCRGYGTLPKHSRELDTTHTNSVLEAELIEEQRRGTAEDVEESVPCPVCHGSRLNEEARNVLVHGLDIGTLTGQPVTAAQASLTKFKFAGTQEIIARDILAEVAQRLTFLSEVGLGYLQLNRAATTLSGGESQRIRLASQLGSNLRGVLYVLDEPTIGLHPRDNVKLLDTLTALRDKGNSLIVVEHDEDTMRRSDLVIDLGPGAGMFGGEITAQGTWEEIQHNPASVTGRALREPMRHPSRGARRPLPEVSLTDSWLTVSGARANNLKHISASIPLGRLTVLSGISGSGKSSLMRGVIQPAVAEALRHGWTSIPADFPAKARKGRSKTAPPSLACDRVEGIGGIEAVYEVDQSPIGKTSRSTPATYIKVFDGIRTLFASLPAAKMRGYTASRFSFNTEGGRCEACGGNGVIRHEMAFLPASHVVCTECRGLRYNAPTLEIDYSGKNIGDVMNMTIDEAADFFSAHSKISRTLRLLADTGTGYLQLGQPSPTLSGGEAQRLKLVAELSRGLSRTAHERIRKNRQPKGNLYLIEEPTIGLHPTDVAKLIDVLHRLVDDGHTVLVIEHNLDVIAEADHILDIGPEAGEAGGTVTAIGTPEQIAKSKVSRTAPFLAEVLKDRTAPAAPAPAVAAVSPVIPVVSRSKPAPAKAKRAKRQP
ncbi:MAG: excinuclease subunit [Verrucomicrobiales bacterium]|nr:excinuclease subunit [Verrucomicrobiales bacterium]